MVKFEDIDVQADSIGIENQFRMGNGKNWYLHVKVKASLSICPSLLEQELLSDDSLFQATYSNLLVPDNWIDFPENLYKNQKSLVVLMMDEEREWYKHLPKIFTPTPYTTIYGWRPQNKRGGFSVSYDHLVHGEDGSVVITPEKVWNHMHNEIRHIEEEIHTAICTFREEYLRRFLENTPAFNEVPHYPKPKIYEEMRKDRERAFMDRLRKSRQSTSGFSDSDGPPMFAPGEYTAIGYIDHPQAR